MEEKVKIIIDGIEMEVPKTYTILDAARKARNRYSYIMPFKRYK